jgi:hypothetical protein
VSLLFALTLLQAASDVATTAPAEDPAITVVGERMKRIKLRLDRKGTLLRKCTIRVSSGDPAIDGYACQAVAACLTADAQKRKALETCVTDKVLDHYLASRAARESTED